MNTFINQGNQLNNTERSWNGTDKALTGLSTTLLFADIVLIGIYFYKIFHKKNHQIFGDKKTTPILDKVLLFTLVLLITHAVVYLIMVLISNSAASGVTCSVYSFVFYTLNCWVKVLTLCAIFFHYYIWIKQKCLGYLEFNGAPHTVFKLTFAFILSVSTVISFKMNTDTTFVLANGLCYGKSLAFKKDLALISLTASFLVVLSLIGAQSYYLFKTNKEEKKHTPNEKNKLIFELIRRQIYLFLKLHIAIALSLIVYFVKKTGFPSDGMVHFADVGYFVSHLYNFLCCSIVCYFRFKVSTDDIKSEYLSIRKKNLATS